MTMDVDMEREMLETYAPRGRRQEDQIANLRLAQSRAHELKSFAQPGRPGTWTWSLTTPLASFWTRLSFACGIIGY